MAVKLNPETYVEALAAKGMSGDWTHVALAAGTQSSTQLAAGGVYLVACTEMCRITDQADQSSAESEDLTSTGMPIPGGYIFVPILIENGWLGIKTVDSVAADFCLRRITSFPVA